MEKITLIAIAALSLVLTSCNKEQITSEQENVGTFSMTLSASVNETKAAMSDEWKFAFATGDKISLTNDQVATGTYYELTRCSDGNFTGTVTAPPAAATWYAYYPSNNVSLAGQTGTQTGTAAYCALAGKQEDVAAGSKSLNMTLNFQTAILVIDNRRGALDINVKTSDGKWVSGFAAMTGAATFDVTKSDTEVSLFTTTVKGAYYIVVPAGVQIAIYDGDTRIKETKDAGLSAGKYYNISIIPKGFVDLGVTSSGKPLYWAECNLGASKPEDPGDYYMWGATALMYSAVDSDGAFTFVTSNPYGDNYKNTWDAGIGFGWNNIPFAEGVFVSGPTGTKNVFTKYTTNTDYAKSGSPDNITALLPEDDAATNTNSSWRTPTKDEFVALAANCVWVWTTGYKDTGKAGYIVYKSKDPDDKGMANSSGTWKRWNGSSYAKTSDTLQGSYSETKDPHIFLPVTGYCNGTKLANLGDRGNYWSSSLNETNNSQAFGLAILATTINTGGSINRHYGYSIRAVTE